MIKKHHLKRAALELGAILLALLALFYLGYHSLSGYSSAVESEAAVWRSQALSLELRGVIFRDEATVHSGSPDRVVYYAADGEKLGLGDEAAGVFLTAPSQEALGRLAILDRQIMIVEEALELPASVTNYSILAAEITALLGDGYFSGSSSLPIMSADERLKVCVIRAAMKDSREKYEESLASMKRERESLIASLGAYDPITFDDPLFFYRGCDGGEDIFTLSALDTLDASGLDALLERYRTATVTPTAIGKTVSEHAWYLAVSASAEQAALLTEGVTYSVGFEGGIDLKGKLERIDRSGETRLMVFRFSGMPIGFDYSRIQNVSIDYASIEGYRVPTSSIRYIDGRTCVYTVYGGQIFLRTADIAARSGDWCYIAKGSAPLELEDGEVCVGLGQNDFVVVRGRRLYHLKIVE